MKGAVQAGDPPGADSLATRLGLIRYAPQAIKLDKEWTQGVPVLRQRIVARGCPRVEDSQYSCKSQAKSETR
jgi:hypothetical protein